MREKQGEKTVKKHLTAGVPVFALMINTHIGNFDDFESYKDTQTYSKQLRQSKRPVNTKKVKLRASRVLPAIGRKKKKNVNAASFNSSHK